MNLREFTVDDPTDFDLSNQKGEDFRLGRCQGTLLGVKSTRHLRFHHCHLRGSGIKLGKAVAYC